ncbi:MAG: DUF309 domain-containing protein [Halobacteriales archaeon]|nr:DUF309 domain-containing protein [Halobacteriales archaeon]
MDVSLADRLRAGVAVFNAGHYHAAHDAWEPPYRAAEGDRRAYLQGLIQFAAAAHHVTTGNREGSQGLADSALEYLDGHDGDIDLDPVRAWLTACRDDYERVANERPPALTYAGERLDVRDLQYPAVAVAAPLVADATGYDADLLDSGAEFALADLPDDPNSPFVTLVLDFLHGERRGVIVQRLDQHVTRRQAREDDVTGLFDT